MEKKDEFIQLIEPIKNRIGMYFIDPTFEKVSIFISGIDYSLDTAMLHGFEEWLLNKYMFYDCRKWPYILDNYFQKNGIVKEDDKISILFDHIYEYISNNK